MAILKLDVDIINSFKSNEYFINDFDIRDDSLEKLAALLGTSPDDAFDWFMENYEIVREDIKVIEFYNQKIKRQDLHVYCNNELVAYHKDIKVIAVIKWDKDKMYKHKVAQRFLKEQKAKQVMLDNYLAYFKEHDLLEGYENGDVYLYAYVDATGNFTSHFRGREFKVLTKGKCRINGAWNKEYLNGKAGFMADAERLIDKINDHLEGGLFYV
ncbi:hypothetical protein [Streptococcus sp. zg-JUN1979]|uniref:hypothetical protein n=1 Tax=Streptococcus sp. zg-JUN1979 TaxID=3391450 RepID=UPI0039A63BD1